MSSRCSHVRIVQSFCHQVGNLLLCIDVKHADSRVGAYLEEPVDVDPVSPGQMPQRHRARFLDDLDYRLVVFGDDEDSSLCSLSGVREVLSRVEEL